MLSLSLTHSHTHTHTNTHTHTHTQVFQLGTATTQICESFAVAAQSLLARELQGTDAARKRIASIHIIQRAVLAGGLASALLSFFTWWKQSSVLAGLTSDPAVLAAAGAIMPIVLVTQVSKGLAYPVNGVVMGGQDWGYLSFATWFSNACCCAIVFFFKVRYNYLIVMSGGEVGAWWSLGDDIISVTSHESVAR